MKSRKIWFLYEWLLQKQLNIPNADVKIKYTPFLITDIQFALTGKASPRHRIINNLPGTVDFCPLIFKTPKLEQYMRADFAGQKKRIT